MTTRTSLLVLLGAFAWAGSPLITSAADAAAPVRSITTVGVAEQEYAPDRAHLSVEIKVVGPSRKDSSESTDVVHQKLAGAMKDVGIAEGDVMLRMRKMEREYEYSNNRRSFLGFACSENWEIVVRDLGLLTRVTETLAGIEEVDLDHIEFHGSQEAEIKRQALLRAAEAAREKAGMLAQAADVRITGLIELTETGSQVENERWRSGSVTGNYAGIAESEGGIGTKRIYVAVRARYAIE